jgi:guanine deaminase
LDLPIQSHLCETPKEIEWVLELEPQATSYADVYHRYGLLNEKTLMAHAVYPSKKDIELLQHTQATVVHCPTSNCNLGSGIAPIRQLLDAGVNIAMGTDVAAGHHLSMLRTMQYAIQMSKMIYAQNNREVSFLSLAEAFYMATKAGGRLFGAVGSFEVGYEFDALVIDDAALADKLGTRPEQLYERLERFIYTGSEQQIERRFCSGCEVVV